MKTKSLLRRMTVQEAYSNLEAAAAKIVKEANWESPFNGFMSKGHPIRHRVNELRKPLLELRLAKRNA